ncbi:MAG TPA: CBS domain-containing protein [Dehalococcoidia bacterium]|nr:CBS domain-containing protein [Dehalococcoidia bacterium]
MNILKVSRLDILLRRFRGSEFAFGATLAVVAGIAAGLGAVFFRWLIGSFNRLFFSGGAEVLGFLGQYYVILLPAIGGLIVGSLIYFSRAAEAKGHGVPEVMEAIATKGGRIRARVAAVKILASSICIGSGGSVGREGPIVQIGSTVGSILGQRLLLSQEWIKTLVACGAAGGISATFNAPIAGVFFAHEVILGRVLTRHFGFVVISSVVAGVVAHSFLGDYQSFSVPAYTLNSYWELLFYFILGVACALIAVAFIRMLYKTEDIFAAVNMPEYLKPALGGIAVGLIGLYSPYLFGVGYQGVERALLGEIGLFTLTGLLLLKILATSFTLGSGGSGGIFAPSLFMGAMFGGIFGEVANRLFPGITAPSGAYALVGMAAVFSAAARAPITAIIILFEMTRDYAIILPLMLAVVVGTLIAYRLSPESIYTLKLRRRGISLRAREEVDLLERVTVAEVMTRDFPTVSPEMSLAELAEKFTKSKHHGFPVVDVQGNLRGMVTLADLESRMGTGEGLTVADIATTNLVTAYPDESLHDVVHRLGAREVGRVPVVDRRKPSRLLGVLRRYDVVKAYVKAISQLPKD